MNGERRFVLGTVLSIQNKNFSYPACQNCLSRLTQTTSRFHCRKCGHICEDAPHRYRVCVKIAEEQTLHVVTVFGKCLENIFGTSASSLHRLLQASDHLPCSGEGGKARGLLFQAAEDCLIGRNFIFATKVPDNLRNGFLPFPSDLVAYQIIPVNNDTTGRTILNRYYCLATSILSSSSFHSEADLSSDATERVLRDLSDSKNSTSLHQSGSQFPDYWQQSLGLISSPTVNTSAKSTPSDPCHSQLKKAKEQLFEENSTFQEKENFVQKPEVSNYITFAATDHPNIPLNSHFTFNKSPISTFKPSTDTRGFRPQQSSAHFHSLASQSAVPCWQHGYLQNVCNSGSYGSQDRSACLKHFPSPNVQTAESHQAENGAWDEFPFSESLNEFIVSLENAEETRSCSRFKQTKCCFSDKKEETGGRLFKNTSEFIKTPEALLGKNKTAIETATQNNLGRYSESNALLGDFSKIFPTAISSFEEAFQQGLELGDLQSLLNNSFVHHFMSADNSRNSQCRIFLHKKNNAPYVIAENDKDLQIHVNSNINMQERFFPPKKAQDENHELIRHAVEEHGSISETWDEFTFTESLSEFIGRLENAMETRLCSGFKENKFCLCSRRKKGCVRRSNNISKLIKTPETFLARPCQKAKNTTQPKITTRNCFAGDIESNASKNDVCKTVQSVLGRSSSGDSCDGSALENLGGPLENFLSYMPVNSFASEATREKIPNISAGGKEDFQAPNFSLHLLKNIMDHLASSSPAFEGNINQILNEEDQRQLKSATFNNLPIYESSSNLTARVENGEEKKIHSSFKDAKFSLRNKKKEAHRSRFQTTPNHIKTPEAFLASSRKKVSNETQTITTAQQSLDDSGDSELITFVYNPSEIGNTCFSPKEPVECSPPRNFWRRSREGFGLDIMSIDSLANSSAIQNTSGSSHWKTCLTKNKNAPYVIASKKRNVPVCHFSSQVTKKKNQYIFPVGQGVVSSLKEDGYVDDERMLKDYHLRKATPDDLKSVSSFENYNASEDLFDPDNSMDELLEENQQPKLRPLKRRYGSEIESIKSASLVDSPCSDFIVPHRFSPVRISYLQDHLKTSADDRVEQILEKKQKLKYKRSFRRSYGIESFKATHRAYFPHSDAIIPCRRPDSHSGYLEERRKTAAVQLQNLLPRLQSTPLLKQFTERRSSNSLTGFLMRKRRLSLSNFTQFSAFLEKIPTCSPISASFLGSESSRGEKLQQDMTLVYKSAAKNKKKGDIQIYSQKSRDGIGCVTRTLDNSMVTRPRTNQSMEGTISDCASVALVTSSSQVSVLNSLAGYWSPELFYEKSTIIDQTDSVQRRLF